MHIDYSHNKSEYVRPLSDTIARFERINSIEDDSEKVNAIVGAFDLGEEMVLFTQSEF